MASNIRCFYRPNGSLPEVVGNRGIQITSENPEDWVKAIQENTREVMRGKILVARKWAIHQDWSLTTQKICSIVNTDEQVRRREAGSKDS
jgi:hypothetical protein